MLEKNFRALVKDHLATLTESRRTFWKQRNTFRWVNLGDENTSYFHNMATISHKKNFITCLVTPEDSIIFDHEQKAQFLWESFRKRMGVTEYTNMYYDLSNLITALPMEQFCLDDDFSEEEIISTIKNLPNNHAPGLDGFNGSFIKNCWDIIKNDFFRLFRDFCNTDWT